MADISKIEIEGTSYDIKDVTSRNAVNRLNLLVNKKVIMIGDSYAQGYTPDGYVTGWPTVVKNILGLSNTNCIIKAYGGTGFCNTVDDKNFLTLLNEVASDNDVTDIIVCGGYNDKSYSKSVIETAIDNFKTSANTKFPNAKIHIGFIALSTDSNERMDLYFTCSRYLGHSEELNIHFLHNCQYTLHNYMLFSSDGIHPNATGNSQLGRNIAQAFIYGSCSVIGPYINIVLKNINSSLSGQSISNTLASQLNNNIVQVSTQGYSQVTLSTPQTLDGSGLLLKIGDIDISSTSYIYGDKYYICKAYVPLVIKDSNNHYHNANGYLYFRSGSLYLKVQPLINDAGNNFLTLQLTQIQLSDGCVATFEAFFC